MVCAASLDHSDVVRQALLSTLDETSSLGRIVGYTLLPVGLGFGSVREIPVHRELISNRHAC